MPSSLDLLYECTTVFEHRLHSDFLRHNSHPSRERSDRCGPDPSGRTGGKAHGRVTE
jgi:hypothetical protein